MIIGLTGGIGSGKTTIARQLEELGYSVFYCDEEAKKIIVYDPVVRNAMTKLLGDDIYDGDKYRTDIVAQRIFADASLLQQVNNIVHPAVAGKVTESTASPLFVESAILYESGFDKLCDYVVAVSAPVEVRISRVMARDGSSEAGVRQRILHQDKHDVINQRADLVVCNDNTVAIDSIVNEIILFVSEKIKQL